MPSKYIVFPSITPSNEFVTTHAYNKHESYDEGSLTLQARPALGGRRSRRSITGDPNIGAQPLNIYTRNPQNDFTSYSAFRLAQIKDHHIWGGSVGICQLKSNLDLLRVQVLLCSKTNSRSKFLSEVPLEVKLKIVAYVQPEAFYKDERQIIDLFRDNAIDNFYPFSALRSVSILQMNNTIKALTRFVNDLKKKGPSDNWSDITMVESDIAAIKSTIDMMNHMRLSTLHIRGGDID